MRILVFVAVGEVLMPYHNRRFDIFLRVVERPDSPKMVWAMRIS
jgi:hypothetical protein